MDRLIPPKPVVNTGIYMIELFPEPYFFMIKNAKRVSEIISAIMYSGLKFSIIFITGRRPGSCIEIQTDKLYQTADG